MKQTSPQLSLIPEVDIMQQVEITDSAVIGHFQDYRIHSVFQPIYSFAHAAPIGYEALLRAVDNSGQQVSPLELFSRITEQHELLELEQLSRTLHILNFIREDTQDAWLFLNINPRLMNNCKNCLQQLLELLNDYNFSPTRIVIEFVEESISESNDLAKTANYLRQNGCLTAIDDFGAGHSNFNRVWDLRPNIVKLDKSIIIRAREDLWFRRIIVNLVELLHESESLVLVEGIENAIDADLAHELNADLHQGYFFGYPKALPFSQDNYNHYLDTFNKTSQGKKDVLKENIISEQLQFLFRQAAMGIQPAINLSQACEGLLNYPYVILCYLLDEEGYQIGHSLFGQHSPHTLDTRYRSLGNTKGANWSRRIYFKRAMAEPITIQYTRPYLSLINAQLCTTLSMAIEVNNKTYVLCCDIKLPKENSKIAPQLKSANIAGN